MYVQITTRCNFHCAHCGFSCTAKGEDMSLEVFEKALEYDDIISIGGGEPTLHPLFSTFLVMSLGKDVFVSTNGSNTKISIALAKMAKKGIITAQLSRSIYHNPISDKVIEAFTKNKQKTIGNYSEWSSFKTDDRRSINYSERILSVGRAKNIKTTIKNECFCSEVLVKPNGKIYYCGCENAPIIGNVWDGFDYPEHECYNERI